MTRPKLLALLLVSERVIATLGLLFNSYLAAHLFDTHIASLYIACATIFQLFASPWLPAADFVISRHESLSSFSSGKDRFWINSWTVYMTVLSCLLAVVFIYISYEVDVRGRAVVFGAILGYISYSTLVRKVTLRYSQPMLYSILVSSGSLTAIFVKFLFYDSITHQYANSSIILPAILFSDLLIVSFFLIFFSRFFENRRKADQQDTKRVLYPPVELLFAATAVFVNVLVSRAHMLIGFVLLPADLFIRLGFSNQVLAGAAVMSPVVSFLFTKRLLIDQHDNSSRKHFLFILSVNFILTVVALLLFIVFGNWVCFRIFGAQYYQEVYSSVVSGFPFCLVILNQAASLSAFNAAQRTDLFIRISLISSGSASLVFGIAFVFGLELQTVLLCWSTVLGALSVFTLNYGCKMYGNLTVKVV